MAKATKVLITGGAKRVGRAVTTWLAQRGYAVAIHAHRSMPEAETLAKSLEQKHSVVTAAVQANLDEETEIDALVEQADAALTGLDAVVHCAAIYSHQPLEEVRAADLEAYFRTNATASFLLARAAGLRMAASGGGAIVLVGDWATVRPYTGYAAYFPSKGTIPTITRLLAVELAERHRDIRVNAILPGPVLPPESLTKDEVDALAEKTLLKRVGTPEVVAHAAEFLLENDYVTGVCLPVDGGRTIYAPD